MRSVAVLVCAVLASIGLGRAPAVAHDEPPGEDLVSTALAYSARLPDGGTPHVLVAGTGSFADALSSGLLQGHWDAPLLLTGTDALDVRVRDEIDRLGSDRVTILGGTQAVSEVVGASLDGLVDEVDRIAGGTRITTALAVADAVLDELDTDSVILVRAFGGEDGETSAAFADALGAGAAAATRGYPVVLTATDGLAEETAEWLLARDIRRVIIAGGTAAVGPEVEVQLAELGVEQILRLSSETRIGTAVVLAGRTRAVGTVAVVRGDQDTSWASGLAAALHAPGGVLLTGGKEVPADTLSGVLGIGTGVDGLLCGPDVPASACRVLTAAAEVPLLEDPHMALLDSDQVVPPASPGASATARLWQVGEDALCTGLTLDGEPDGRPLSADIRAGGFGEEGAAVLDLAIAPQETLAESAVGCAVGVTPAVLDQVMAEPAMYHLAVRDERDTGVVMRGQLFAPQAQPTLRAVPSAVEVVGAPGDPDAAGFGLIIPTGVADELCVSLQVDGLDGPATGAHLHRGDHGEEGEAVVELAVPVDEERSQRCQRGVDPDLLSRIFAEPEAFYLDVHTADHPRGAVRAQLIIDHASAEH